MCGNDYVVPTEIERLYREHRAGLVRLVERELHDRHDAEDVVQTAFLDAQRALERGTTPRNPRAWLAAIALNAGRHLRRRRLNAGPLEEYAAQEASRVPEIRAALASLPVEQRAAVVYRDVLGLSYGETAEQMGKSINAVTMLLHRGRGRLREALGITAGGIGLWRWLRRAGMPQAAVAKGTGAVVVAAGLATSGVVAARVIAPIGTDMKAVPPVARSGRLADRAGQAPSSMPALDPARRHLEVGSSRVSAVVPAPTRDSGGATASTALPSSTAFSSRVPTVSLPKLPSITSPVTVAAQVTVSAPITAVTVTVPTSTTATVATPIATVTLPIP